MKTVLTLVILAIVLAGGFVLYTQYEDEILSFVENSETVRKLQNLPVIQQINKETNLPGALRSERDSPNAHLTKNGAIEWTNIHRAQNNLQPLAENETLNRSAENKLNDMFQNQYFAHDAPDGTTPGEVVEESGYVYITTGENLALGNFENDEELVQAWMDSPGHRENILHNKYTEIGIAVGQGMYEGRQTWLAVQHFGKPTSACPQVNHGLRDQIDQKQALAEELEADVARRRNELDSQNPQTREEVDEYNREVEEYNAKVAEYNAVVAEVKSLINTFNAQVNNFNACAEE